MPGMGLTERWPEARFKDQSGAVSPAMSRLTPGLLAAKVGVHRLMEM
jgi:hypothetical protein